MAFVQLFAKKGELFFGGVHCGCDHDERDVFNCGSVYQVCRLSGVVFVLYIVMSVWQNLFFMADVLKSIAGEAN